MIYKSRRTGIKHIRERSGFENMWTLITILSVIAVSQAGRLPESFHGRVINGEDAVLGEIPYQVSLQYVYNNFHFCGGSVLNEKYVITAAHCIQGKSPSQIKVIAATVDLKDPQSEFKVEKIIKHTKYNSYDSWVHDIALIKIKDEFVVNKVLNFVSLPPKGYVVPEKAVARISGWGSLWEGGMSPDVLQKAEIETAEHNYCKQVYKNIALNIYQTHLCAYDPVESTGSCHGDSGGPLVVDEKLVGLVSWANGCASTKYPTVYTRVTEYLDWIEENAV
ncbi:trypsin-1-like [Chelonus insularis]|uniref:trypsin-1-like n=1 Tax=Chelonus insularis TaxID=460826 RepID=UPI00158C7C94|nr:trypsin-1-like [Chelonus insularis]